MPHEVRSTCTVVEVTDADEKLLEAVTSLLPQLSSSPPPLTLSQLEEIVTSPATRLYVARDGSGTVLGMLTLALFRVPTGVRAWIEDVVVDTEARGEGVGAALVEAALASASRLGVRSVDLTSRPSRVAANRLYRSMGFAPRQTNVYRWEPHAHPVGG